MYNVTSLVTLAEDISPIMNLLAILAQAIATIGLFIVTYFLWKATSELRNYAKDQTDIMGKQAGHAEKQNVIMDKQITILEDQKEITDSEVNAMKEDREYSVRVEKYRRLREEMDLLVGPLFVKTFLVTDSDKGFFSPLDVNSRQQIKRQGKGDLLEFWDDILEHSHLSRSEELSEYLHRHFEFNYKSIGLREPEHEQIFINNRVILIAKIKDRYLELKNELYEIEKELGMRKHD